MDSPLSMCFTGKEVNGITVHETVPGGDRRSASGFHSPPNNDQFLRGRGVSALDNPRIGFMDLLEYRSWLPKPGEITNS